jgi:hypothetical protein
MNYYTMPSTINVLLSVESLVITCTLMPCLCNQIAIVLINVEIPLTT